MSNSLLMEQLLEHFAIGVAAIGGVLAARGKRVDLFGVVVLALVTAYGGGTVRDILVGDGPVAWLRNPAYLLNASLVAVATFFVRRLHELPENFLLVADAFALALFTIVGTRKGVDLHFAAPVSVLLGVITGVAGGILRDVLTGDVPMVFRPHIRLYATAAMAGAIAFVILHQWWPGHHAVTVAAISLILALRVLGIWLKISLPVFQPDSVPTPAVQPQPKP
jgi:uncharacterized membrane protein YeiH